MNKAFTYLLTLIIILIGSESKAQSVLRNNFSVFNPIDSNDSLLIAGGQILTKIGESPTIQHGYYPLSQSLLSLNEKSIDLIFSVYPNPFINSFTLAWTNVEQNLIEIEVYGIDGQFIYRFENISESTYEVDMSKLSVGIYFIKVVYNTEVIYSQKLIKA